MNQIENFKIIQGRISDWKISDIALIKSMLFFSDEDCKSITLRITFLSQSRYSSSIWPNFKEPFNVITLLFYNVSNFKFNFEGSLMPQLIDFGIVDISSCQWENAKFKINDFENEVVSFICTKIEAESIDATEKLNW